MRFGFSAFLIITKCSCLRVRPNEIQCLHRCVCEVQESPKTICCKFREELIESRFHEIQRRSCVESARERTMTTCTANEQGSSCIINLSFVLLVSFDGPTTPIVHHLYFCRKHDEERNTFISVISEPAPSLRVYQSRTWRSSRTREGSRARGCDEEVNGIARQSARQCRPDPSPTASTPHSSRENIARFSELVTRALMQKRTRRRSGPRQSRSVE